VHHAAPVSYPEPHAENVQNANSLASVYHLYDRGVNERLMGHYERATKTLREASNAYTSSRSGLTLEAMIDYELGQAAEASNNYQVAADAYARALRIKPNLIEAAVRLTSMLMKAGQPQAALSRARESVSMNPNDPRAHQILALVLDNNGLNADAKIERDSAERLLRSRSSINYADVPMEQNIEPMRQTTTSPDKQNPVGDVNNGGNAGNGNVDNGNSGNSNAGNSNAGNSNASSESSSSSVNSANESERRRARQEEQWRIYQQMHTQQSGQTQQQNNQRYSTEKRPFHSTGEFYRARVEPVNKSSNTVIEKRETSDFPNGSSESVKTYTPMQPKSSAGDKSKTSTDGAKNSASDGNGTRSSTPTDPVDNDVMP
jgi:tetratricopeptide (TPR) repeat protein